MVMVTAATTAAEATATSKAEVTDTGLSVTVMMIVPGRVGLDLAVPELTIDKAVRALRCLVHLQGVGEVVVLSFSRFCISSESKSASVQS